MAGIPRDTTAAIIDGITRFVAAGGFLTTVLVAPRAAEIFDKPVTKLLDQLDDRQRQRELRRIIHYMKSRGLIQYDPRDYEHGITLTKAGKKRSKQADFNIVSIPRQAKWDKKWRLVLFDIPESYRPQRKALNKKLAELGYKRLQFSAWVHPYPSRAEIEHIVIFLGVEKYVSYLEVSGIDAEHILKKRFSDLL